MLRCLIVDDSSVFLEAARDLLERGGAMVAIASNSAEALSRVEELRPDVALLDVNLGDESGFELARRLHSDGGMAPAQLILISTQSEDDYAELIADSPVAGFLPKAALSVSAIREFLDGR
jgi:two-component system, NarL family, nitrate/nitrite response regulator NarL